MDPFPPDPRAKRPGLGKLWLGILVALIAIAAVAYLVYDNLLMNPAATGTTPSDTPGTTAAEVSVPPQQPVVAVEPNRSETILTCSAADGAVFYTNATRCELADLENRVNVIPVAEPAPQSARECLGAQPGGPRVHGFLAVCLEPFNKALELEPFLLESDDPASSRTAQRYCALITEGVQAGCMATSDQFCFLDVCQVLREAAEP